MEKILKKFNSFADQDQQDVKYWKTVDPNVRVEILESIRAMYMESSGEGQQGFQRILRVIERP